MTKPKSCVVVPLHSNPNSISRFRPAECPLESSVDGGSAMARRAEHRQRGRMTAHIQMREYSPYLLDLLPILGRTFTRHLRFLPTQPSTVSEVRFAFPVSRWRVDSYLWGVHSDNRYNKIMKKSAILVTCLADEKERNVGSTNRYLRLAIGTSSARNSDIHPSQT
jgi:hypothetical protein